MSQKIAVITVGSRRLGENAALQLDVGDSQRFDVFVSEVQNLLKNV